MGIAATDGPDAARPLSLMRGAISEQSRSPAIEMGLLIKRKPDFFRGEKGRLAEEFTPQSLRLLDRRGYTVLEALTHDARRSASTHATPHTFVCIDGSTYWVKGRAQQGLVAELIAGRLAARLGAGPMAQIVRVTEEALPQEAGEVRDQAKSLLGVVVGLEDQHGTMNARELQPLIDNSQFAPDTIDPRSRALVVAFHTWLGVNDAQVLVRLSDGTVLSIDHGDGFGSMGAGGQPQVIMIPIPGVSNDVGREMRYVDPSIRKIEQVRNAQLLEAVSGVPLGDAWRSPLERRVEIAAWLASRRDRLREVMTQWAQR